MGGSQHYMALYALSPTLLYMLPSLRLVHIMFADSAPHLILMGRPICVTPHRGGMLSTSMVGFAGKTILWKRLAIYTINDNVMTLGLYSCSMTLDSHDTDSSEITSYTIQMSTHSLQLRRVLNWYYHKIYMVSSTSRRFHLGFSASLTQIEHLGGQQQAIL